MSNKSPNASSGPSVLPSKEQSLYKQLMVHYENKQYKKANKMADLILKNFAEHPETLSMKALVLSGLFGQLRRPEAIEYAKKAVKFGMHISVCWHALGILVRLDSDYNEAMNCFSIAHKLDSKNMLILRDLSCLQLQERRYVAFRESRKHIVNLQPKACREWAALALAHHLCGDLSAACDIMDVITTHFLWSPDIDSFAQSELLMYCASLLEESNRNEKCLKFLEDHRRNISNTTEYLEILGRIKLKCGMVQEALLDYETLFASNTENERYLLCVLYCQSLSSKADSLLSGFFGFLNLNRSVAGDASSFTPFGGSMSNSLSLSDTMEWPEEEACVCITSDAFEAKNRTSWGWLKMPPSIVAARSSSSATFSLALSAMKKRGSFYWRKSKSDFGLPLWYLMREMSALEQERFNAFMQELSLRHPSSELLQKFPLPFLSGDLFISRLEDYLIKKIRSGVPATFRLIRNLYTPSRVPIISKILECFVRNLRGVPSVFKLPASPKVEEIDAEPPTCLLYALLFLSQHYDYVNELTSALRTIDEAIQHTPTCIDAYSVKAKILKHSGAYQDAASLQEKARSLDFADRYINSKAIKYFYNAGRISEARAVSLMFIRSNQLETQESDVKQLWLEVKKAISLERVGEYGLALASYHNIMKHFQSLKGDQLDFHLYCMRHLAYRSYTNFLKTVDAFCSHRFYRQAALNSVRIYLQVYDAQKTKDEQLPNGNPVDSNAAVVEGKSGDAKSESSDKKKKSKIKAKKENARSSCEKPGTIAPAQSVPSKEASSLATQGEKLLAEDPLVKVWTILQTLQTCGKWVPRFHLYKFELAYRRDKLLMMTEALLSLWLLNEKSLLSRQVAPLFYRFCLKAAKIAPIAGLEASVLQEALDLLLSRQTSKSPSQPGSDCKISEDIVITAEQLSLEAETVFEEYIQKLLNEDSVERILMIKDGIKAIIATDVDAVSNSKFQRLFDQLLKNYPNLRWSTCEKTLKVLDCQSTLSEYHDIFKASFNLIFSPKQQHRFHHIIMGHTMRKSLGVKTSFFLLLATALACCFHQRLSVCEIQ